MVLCDGDSLEERDLPPRIKAASEADDGAIRGSEAGPAGQTFKELTQKAAENAEKELIEKALRETGGNKTLAAKNLGISRRTLFNKIKALKIQSPGSG